MAFVRAILLALIFSAIGLAKSGFAAPPTVATPIPVATAVEPDDGGISVVPDSNKPLGPGDTVSFEIIEDKTGPINKIISDTGSLDVPYLGSVSVKGKSCAEAAAQIKRQLEATYYRPGHGTVRLSIERVGVRAKGPPTKVMVSGYVTTVGIVEVPSGEKLTASQAVVKAGGATQFGDLRKVRLTRKNPDGTSKSFPIDLKAILQEGHAEKDMDVQDGDSIFVPQKLFNFGGG